MAWDTEGTKRKILLAAVDEFAAHGPDGTTIERIAKAAGVNKERVYNRRRRRGLCRARLRLPSRASSAQSAASVGRPRLGRGRPERRRPPGSVSREDVGRRRRPGKRACDGGDRRRPPGFPHSLPRGVVVGRPAGSRDGLQADRRKRASAQKGVGGGGRQTPGGARRPRASARLRQLRMPGLRPICVWSPSTRRSAPDGRLFRRRPRTCVCLRMWHNRYEHKRAPGSVKV